MYLKSVIISVKNQELRVINCGCEKMDFRFVKYVFSVKDNTECYTCIMSNVIYFHAAAVNCNDV